LRENILGLPRIRGIAFEKTPGVLLIVVTCCVKMINKALWNERKLAEAWKESGSNHGKTCLHIQGIKNQNV
jgi:hypothetical protein